MISTSSLEILSRKAQAVSQKEFGSRVLLRGIVEFSSYCRNTCRYCGLNCNSKGIPRYRMKSEQILSSVEQLYKDGIRTVVLQSGEDPELTSGWLASLIGQIKSRWDIAVTLSVGEWPKEYYRAWRLAGADRFLLKMETYTQKFYQEFHPGMSFVNRLRCLDALGDLGYQLGSGIIVGLPGQSPEILEDDLRAMEKAAYDMISIGPFIPHPKTDLAGFGPGSVEKNCELLARTRQLVSGAHMPATSALGSEIPDKRHLALLSGANVLMPNYTPDWCSDLYDIYPHQRRLLAKAKPSALGDALREIKKAGMIPDFSRGDSKKSQLSAGRIQKNK